MAHKYIRENKNSCSIVKSSKTYARIGDLDDAIFIRNLLEEHDWNLDEIPNTVRCDGQYMILAAIDGKLHLLLKSQSEPSQAEIDALIKRKIRNPNNSRYGLNITRVFDVFVIKKMIFGEDHIFGYYDRLEDAEFVRNFLLENEWNVNAFEKIEFDGEKNLYRAIDVIDDRVYVLDSFKSGDIDLDRVYSEFLAKIIKHAHGISNHPHLDSLTDKIDELELKFGVKASDENWDLEKLDSSPLDEIIFNLTPFQKSVYDAIGQNTSFDEIKMALIRFKSKNFENKIRRNLDELEDMGLVERTGEVYKKL